MTTYTRAEVDAEIHKLLKSTQEMLEQFEVSDAEAMAKYKEANQHNSHCDWLKGRMAAYKLAANHIDRLKEGYQ